MHWSCIFTYTIHLVHLQAKFIFPSWMLFEGPLGQSDKLRKVAITAAVMEEHQSGGSKQFCKVILTGLWLGLSTSTLQNPKNTRWWTCVLTVHLDEWFWAAWNHTLLVNLSLRCLRMSFKSVCLYDGTSLAGWPIVAHKKCIPLWGLRPLLQVPSSLSPWSWVQYGQCQVIAKPQMQAG